MATWKTDPLAYFDRQVQRQQHLGFGSSDQSCLKKYQTGAGNWEVNIFLLYGNNCMKLFVFLKSPTWVKLSWIFLQPDWLPKVLSRTGWCNETMEGLEIYIMKFASQTGFARSQTLPSTRCVLFIICPVAVVVSFPSWGGKSSALLSTSFIMFHRGGLFCEASPWPRLDWLEFRVDSEFQRRMPCWT